MAQLLGALTLMCLRVLANLGLLLLLGHLANPMYPKSKLTARMARTAKSLRHPHPEVVQLMWYADRISCSKFLY